jgi:predicted ATP-dependent endonuclease of OLD family
MRRVSIDLAANATATVLVGPNNSGKTSVMDALRLFVGTGSDAPNISLHDLLRDRHRDLSDPSNLLLALSLTQKP